MARLLAEVLASVLASSFQHGFSTGRLFCSTLPLDADESSDSSCSTLSVEDSPIQTQSEAMPVLLRRTSNVVLPRSESKENAKGKFPPKLLYEQQLHSYLIDSLFFCLLE